MDDRDIVLYFFKRDKEMLFRKVSEAAKLLKVNPRLIRNELSTSSRKLEFFIDQGVLIMELSDYIREEIEVAKMRGITLTEADVRRRLKVPEPLQEESVDHPATVTSDKTGVKQEKNREKKVRKTFGPDDISEMKKMRETGCKISVIAKHFDCPGQLVADIIST